MINRAYGKIEFICDDCEQAALGPVDANDFDILVDKAKDARWKTRKEKGEWKHYCPDCQTTPTNRGSLL